jgi:hypothetical protein
MSAKPVVLLEIVWPRLTICYVPRSVRKFLQHDAVFQKIQVVRQEIAYVPDIADLKQNTSTSINALAITFDCPRSCLKLSLEHCLHPPGHQGKHPVLVEIRNSKLVTQFDKTPKIAHQLRDKKSSITIGANSKLQSLGIG